MNDLIRTAFAALTLSVCQSAVSDSSDQETLADYLNTNSGGNLTVTSADARVLLERPPVLNQQQRKLRDRGHAFFNTLFLPGPSEVPLRDGLGPLFIGASCEVCHNRLGRGRLPRPEDRQPVALVLQLSTQLDQNLWQDFHPVYGANFNPSSIPGVAAEGAINIQHEPINGAFADGQPWQLTAPIYTLTDLAYGPLQRTGIRRTAISPRMTQSLIGIGLLEAIPAATILANADPDDDNADGISGRPNRIPTVNSTTQLGRFGWKANQINLRDQTTAALLNEQGITSHDRPEQNCTPFQPACMAAQSSEKPEIAETDLNAILTFLRYIPVPARRNVADPTVIRGAQLFQQAACHACHTAHFKTGQMSNDPALAEQDIYPFSDLLLHDMGEELADNRPDHAANGREWRTPPLWGIGLTQAISGEEAYLHDGRARSLQEAILWHGGEAHTSRETFRYFSANDRNALIAFLRSL